MNLERIAKWEKIERKKGKKVINDRNLLSDQGECNFETVNLEYLFFCFNIFLCFYKYMIIY